MNAFVAKKRGSAQVEAAMVFPLIILTVFFTLCLLTSMYSQVTLRSQAHVALRSASGIFADTIMRPEERAPGDIYDSILETNRLEKLLKEQAEAKLSRIAGVEQMEGIEERYSLLPIPIISLEFDKAYSIPWPIKELLNTANTASYFHIDEAQWIRNQDWLAENQEGAMKKKSEK